MSLPAYIRTLAGRFFHRSELADDMEEELRSHIEHRADDLERSGLDRATAERRARIEFGAQERYKEESYEALGGNLLDTLLRDVRLAIRVLRRSPGFLVAAVLTLALAIGANAVVFGIMDGLILRPLKVPQVGTLLGTHYGDGSGFQSYANYLDLRDHNHSFDDLAAFNMVFVGLDKGNDPAAASGFSATGNYFDVLGIHPFLGRFFHASDEHGPNSAPYLVLTYAFWHSRFQDDRGVIGRVVQLDKHPYTIIGVAPPGFQGTILFVGPDFFMPIVNQEQVAPEGSLTSRASIHSIFETFGRLKPGVTHAQATDDVNAIGASLAKTYPKEVSHEATKLARPGLTAFAGPASAFVAGLMLLSGLILLAACANLGSLFAAHSADRSREVALRLALGSSRNRILRQLLTEALVISLAGGALGLMASVALLRKISVWQPFAGAPLHLPVSPDARLYIVAVALALMSGFLFGIVPVRQLLRANPYEIVKAGSSPRLGRRVTLRDTLLVLQIAICAVLVTSSMVAVRGLVRSLKSDFGFEPRNAMLLGANLGMAGYDGDRVLPAQKRLIDAMASIPGVEHVGLVNNYPPLVYTAAFRANMFKDETRDLSNANAASAPYKYEVSPGYFEAAGTHLLAGRSFDWHDDKNAPPVAIANAEFARKMFGSVADTIGKFCRRQNGVRVQIVGVVEDGKYLGITDQLEPAIFLPTLQAPLNNAYLVVRSRSDPQELATAMRSKAREVDSGLPVDIRSWNDMLSVVLFPSRMATASLGVLGFMGAMLSITGIFGMAAYSVSKRLRELGIRMALGAKRTEVLKAALGRAVRLLAVGSATGLVLGILASKVLASIVYQATSRDPLVLAGVVVAMALLGVLATWIPAQRALAVNPLILLRED
jgi:predicted permease